MITPEDDEDREWEELTTAEFFKGYAESDAIYDDFYSPPSDDSQRQNVEQLRADRERRE